MRACIVACGALALDVRRIAARRDWDVEVVPVEVEVVPDEVVVVVVVALPPASWAQVRPVGETLSRSTTMLFFTSRPMVNSPSLR